MKSQFRNSKLEEKFRLHRLGGVIPEPEKPQVEAKVNSALVVGGILILVAAVTAIIYAVNG